MNKKGFLKSVVRITAWLMTAALFIPQAQVLSVRAEDYTTENGSEDQEVDKRALIEPILYRFDTGEELYTGSEAYRPYLNDRSLPDYPDLPSRVKIYTQLPKDFSRGGLKSGTESHVIDLDDPAYATTYYDQAGDVSSCYYTYDVTYDLNYNGTGILVQKSSDNEKLIYAIAKPEKGETELEWKLAENTVSVVVNYEHEYTRLYTYDTWTDYSATGYSGTSVPAYVAYNAGSFYSDKGIETLTGTNSEIDTGISSVIMRGKPNGDSSYTLNYNAYYPYSYPDQGDTFNVSLTGVVIARKEKLTFKKTVDFWFIDTSQIFVDQKDKNVWIKWLDDDKQKTEIEKYRFSQDTKSKLEIKYKYNEGFTMKGLVQAKTGTTDGKNNLEDVFTNTGTEYQLKWKTAFMQDWYETTPNTINDDIPVEIFEMEGATLYFMDVYSPTKIVSVKIPKRPDPPRLKMTIDSKTGDAVISGLKADKHQFRVWYYSGSTPTYINIPESFGTKEAGDTSSSAWYNYIGTKKIDLKTLVKSIPRAAGEEGLEYPEIFIETRTAATETKPQSNINLLHVNEQYSLESSVSLGTTVKFEEGKIMISDAGNNNIYEYKLSDDGEWKKIKKSIVKDKAISSGVVVQLRKAYMKSKNKSITLPSTTTKFTVTLSESAPVMTYKLVDDPSGRQFVQQ